VQPPYAIRLGQRNFWKEGAHGRLADGLVFVYGVERATCSDGTAGRNRGSRREEEEGKEGDGHRQVGSG
jgi:hypothetical protein